VRLTVRSRSVRRYPPSDWLPKQIFLHWTVGLGFSSFDQNLPINAQAGDRGEGLIKMIRASPCRGVAGNL
jgi:hypothetical protein